MFNIDNIKIGMFLSRLIDKKFKSARNFCVAYLKLSGNANPNGDDIQKMANRLSQIKNGKKSIQIYDLPIFSELLDISFEQILSAGNYGVSKNRRLTNYTVAQSHNEKVWLTYIEMNSKPILNPDEYGKTVLDYAIEFSNYDFLKFLMDENYIWFDSRKDKDYIRTFGAGTSIQRIKFEEYYDGAFKRLPGMDDLQYKLATEDQLRMYIIALAAEHNDLKTLEKLRAREIPELYSRTHYLYGMHPDFEAHYDKAMVSCIADSSETVLDYFTTPFQIRDRIKYKDGNNRKHTFLFPYISQLLDMLIKNNCPFSETALKKAIAHNEMTLDKLSMLIQQSVHDYIGWKAEVDFFENGNIVRFLGPISTAGIITNIATVTETSSDTRINQLIEQLNDSYQHIRTIETEDFS